MIKKIIALGALLVVAFSFIACMIDENEKEFTTEQDGLVLTITLDNRVIKIGQELTVNVVLKNNTGRTLDVVLSSTPVILMNIVPIEDGWSFIRDSVAVIGNIMDIDGVIEETITWNAPKQGKYRLMVSAHIGVFPEGADPWAWDLSSVSNVDMSSNEIIIIVE